MKHELLQEVIDYLHAFNFISSDEKQADDILLLTNGRHSICFMQNHMRIYEIPKETKAERLPIFTCSGINLFKDLNNFIYLFHITGVVTLQDFKTAAQKNNAIDLGPISAHHLSQLTSLS